MYCELSSLIFLADPSTSLLERKDSPSIDISHVRMFVLDILGGMVHSHRPLSVMAYSSLLPSLWSLINYDQSDRVLHVVIDHAISVASKSPLKRLTIEFVARLFMVGI